MMHRIVHFYRGGISLSEAKRLPIPELLDLTDTANEINEENKPK